MNWAYTDSTRNFVWRELADGTIESCISSAPEVLAWIAAGNTPEPADTPPTPTFEQERERARATLNPLRDTFLNRLAGIAVFTQDEAVKAECANLRDALLDITKDQGFLGATTYEEMESALMIRYRIIADGAAEAIRNVFRELEI